jgi:DNA-binding response OmpR family regulator
VRALVVSGNRLAGLGLESVARRLGVAVAPATLQEAVALGGGVDLTILYADAWGAESRQAAECLRANHLRFIAVVGELDAATSHHVLASGALNVICAGDEAALASVLASFDWSTADRTGRFVLANAYVVDLALRQVQHQDRSFELSGIECKIMALLRDEALTRPGQPTPVPRIIFAVYGAYAGHMASTLRVHIYRLRGKIEVEPDRPAVLLSQPRRGYWLRLGDAAAAPAGRL